MLHRTSGALLTRKLPTLKLYKIGVKLDMTGKTAANAKTEVLEHERPERKAEMPAPDLSDLELAVIRIVQEDLPNVERPFAEQAAAIGVDEQTIIDTIRSLKERKLMRRFAAVMNHRSAGFKANAMGVWAVPDDQLEEIGPQMATFAAVSHCYRRPDLRRLAVQRVHDGARPHRATARRRSRRSAPRPVSTSTACSGRSRSTRRSGCATSGTSGRTGSARTLPAFRRRKTASVG